MSYIDLLRKIDSRKDEKDQTIALLDLYVNNGADPTILSRRGVSAFTYRLVETLGAIIFSDCVGLPDDFDKLLKLLDGFEDIDAFDPTPLAMSLCAVHSGQQDIAAKVEPAVKKWLENHYKHGLMDLGDADALRVLAFQALQHRAPELTANQAEVVLRFAFGARCSVDVIRALVRPGTVNGDCTRDSEGDEPLLSLAAERGDLEVVDILLDAGADYQANDLSAFQWALMDEHHHIVQRFLDRGLLSVMALHIAIEHGTLDLVKYFTERIPVPDLSARLGGKYTWDAFRSRYANRTVLFTAASKGQIEAAKLLVERGIDVLARDIRGLTASAWAKDKVMREYLEQQENKARLKNEHKGIYSQALPRRFTIWMRKS